MHTHTGNCEVMDVLMNCGNHFAMYGYQIITLSTLNTYNSICQLYLNKAGEEKIKPKK